MSGFIYKLNAMEHASQADHSDKMGYADKRKAVLSHVTELERELAAAQCRIGAIGRIPDVRDRAGVGDGSVYDAVVALTGALAIAKSDLTACQEQLKAAQCPIGISNPEICSAGTCNTCLSAKLKAAQELNAPIPRSIVIDSLSEQLKKAGTRLFDLEQQLQSTNEQLARYKAAEGEKHD